MRYDVVRLASSYDSSHIHRVRRSTYCYDNASPFDDDNDVPRRGFLVRRAEILRLQLDALISRSALCLVHALVESIWTTVSTSGVTYTDS